MTKIYSIIVTYNSSIENIKKKIETIKPQVQKIIICNNSSYPISIKDRNVKIFNFLKNHGIGKAQNIGMQWAFNNGADFVLQLDQDSFPEKHMVKKLLEAYYSATDMGFNIGLVGVQEYDSDSKIIPKNKYINTVKIENVKFEIVSEILSSGSLIPKGTIEKAGWMNETLFIDLVDFEYCWRLKQYNLKVLRHRNALLSHKLGLKEVKLFGIKKINTWQPSRHYYQFRNTLILLKKKYVPIKWKIKSILLLMIKLTLYPIGLSDGRKRLLYMLQGVRDFFKNKTGVITKN